MNTAREVGTFDSSPERSSPPIPGEEAGGAEVFRMELVEVREPGVRGCAASWRRRPQARLAGLVEQVELGPGLHLGGGLVHERVDRRGEVGSVLVGERVE